MTQVHLPEQPLVRCPVKERVNFPVLFLVRCPVMRDPVLLRVLARAAFLVQRPVFPQCWHERQPEFQS